jgi:hypothetical protein
MQPTAALSSRTILGPYEIRSPLGAGGMGEVYRAHDTRLGRYVAIKVLPASFSADRDRLERFAHEARAAAALHHPNSLSIFDIGDERGVFYVVSELLEVPPGLERIVRQTWLSWRRTRFKADPPELLKIQLPPQPMLVARQNKKSSTVSSSLSSGPKRPCRTRCQWSRAMPSRAILDVLRGENAASLCL